MYAIRSYYEEKVFAARAEQGDGSVAGGGEFAGDGPQGGDAETAADEDDGAETFDFRGAAQGACDIENALAAFKAAHFYRGLAHRLHEQGEGAPHFIVMGDGERDALAVLVQSQDHKLAGAGLSGDLGRLNDETEHPRGPFIFGSYNFV